MTRESVCIDIEGASKDNPKKVLVVGAGLAGLEAARRTAFSGHRVTLCESRSWIGGEIRLVAEIPGRHAAGDLLQGDLRQLAKKWGGGRAVPARAAALHQQPAPAVCVCGTA